MWAAVFTLYYSIRTELRFRKSLSVTRLLAEQPRLLTHSQIVVGGGTGGLTVATRLSQRLPDHSVLVIEAGPDGRDVPGIYIPGRKGSTLGSIYDWNFTTTAQPSANGRIIPQNRGRVLGGSSAINLASWDRGADADYDAWEELGSLGWNAANMSAAIRQAETYQLESIEGSTGVTGVGYHGPIDSLVNRFSPPQQEAFFPAMQNLGLQQTFGFLNGDMLGWMRHTSNIRLDNYTRSYSPAYLANAPNNLHLLLNTTVVNVKLNHSAVATGVTLQDGTVLNARREVILSAGTIQSPQILELSGIGNKSILAAAGVEQLVNLPSVGENLQDHIRITTAYQLRPNYTSPDILRFNTSYAAQELDLWYRNRSGFYDETSSGYAYLQWDQVLGNDSTMIAYAKDSASNNIVDQKKLANLIDKSKNVPQVEVLFSDGYFGSKGYPLANSSLYGQQFFAMIAAVEHPFSRGSTHINSSSITAKPVFNPNYLSNVYDLQAIKEAAKYLRKIAQTPPLSYIWTDEYEPGLNVVKTDEDWIEYVKSNMASIWHVLGTCAMLPKDEGGVVSPELKVYGVTGLRVVDASVIPALVSGHIQSAVYGIAERAAEIIAEDWR